MPKLIDLEQRSPEWHAWREGKITASMAPVIMWVSHWQTPRQLYNEIMGITPPKKSNKAMKRGIELEAIALSEFNEIKGFNCKPVCAAHSEIPWLAASLDGWDDDKKELVEIKVPGKIDHQIAKDGGIPGHYIPQLVHQMLVMGVPRCWYYSYHEGDSVLVEMKLDTHYAALLLQQLREFRECLLNFEPPKG